MRHGSVCDTALSSSDFILAWFVKGYIFKGKNTHSSIAFFFLAPRFCKRCVAMLGNFLSVSRYHKFPSLCYFLN